MRCAYINKFIYQPTVLIRIYMRRPKNLLQFITVNTHSFNLFVAMNSCFSFSITLSVLLTKLRNATRSPPCRLSALIHLYCFTRCTGWFRKIVQYVGTLEYRSLWKKVQTKVSDSEWLPRHSFLDLQVQQNLEWEANKEKNKLLTVNFILILI